MRLRDSDSYGFPLESFGIKSVAYFGIKLWNSLPPDLRNITQYMFCKSLSVGYFCNYMYRLMYQNFGDDCQ